MTQNEIAKEIAVAAHITVVNTLVGVLFNDMFKKDETSKEQIEEFFSEIEKGLIAVSREYVSQNELQKLMNDSISDNIDMIKNVAEAD